MFVFRSEDLPADPVFPADLEKLGYFINTNDQIRKVTHPDDEFQFKINRNPRWNEVQRDAMNECVRQIVSTRLHSLGLTTLHLPLSAGPSDPRVPVLVSRNLSTASRVVVVFGEPIQDLGIWAYRSVGTDGINAGSAVSLAEALLSSPNNTSTTDTSNNSKRNETETSKNTALILANTGQLLWHHGTSRPLTHATWLALPRRSAVDPPPTMSTRNKVSRNGSWQEHIDCVFDDLLSSRGKLLHPDARIDIIGVAEGGLGAIRYLKENWEDWRGIISGIGLTNPLHFKHVHLTDEDADEEGSFAWFLERRCRAYVLSPEGLGTPMEGFGLHGCNCYSGGEELNIECIMPRAWGHMLEWLERVHADQGVCEPKLVIRDVEVDELEGIIGGDRVEEVEEEDEVS